MEGLDQEALLGAAGSARAHRAEGMRRATEFGAHLQVPRSALRDGLPSFAPEAFSRAIRTFPQTHGPVRRQALRASDAMVIGERPPLQLPVVRSHPGDAKHKVKPGGNLKDLFEMSPAVTKPQKDSAAQTQFIELN